MFFAVSAHIKRSEVFFLQFVKHEGKFSMPIHVHVQITDTHGSPHGLVSDSEIYEGKIQEKQNQKFSQVTCPEVSPFYLFELLLHFIVVRSIDIPL